MCMLLGVSSRKEILTNEYLRAFYQYSPQHPHGWGLADITSRVSAVIEKESVEAMRSNYLRERLSEPIKSRLLLAHIRYATIGNVEYKNCHPFSGCDSTGRRWTMVHNGTIFDYPELSPYVRVQRGDTDSERIFLYLLERLNKATREKGAKLSFDERFAVIDEIVCDMAGGNKLNLLLTDGRSLYVHSNCRDTLYVLQKDGAALFATTPLTDEGWEPVRFAALLAYRDGRLTARGTEHGREFVENPEQMKTLYQIFSDL